MAVTVTLGLQIKLDRLDEFKNVLREILPDTRGFSGCQDIRVIENQDSLGPITVLEGWDSKEHHIKYMTWRSEIGTTEASAGSVEAEPTITYYARSAPASQMYASWSTQVRWNPVSFRNPPMLSGSMPSNPLSRQESIRGSMIDARISMRRTYSHR